MFAPDTPVPLQYLRLGASVIPLAPHDKRPYSSILDGQTWAPYQNRRPTQDEVRGWLARGVEHNWGVVCGQVSGGLYCGDVDEPVFARWVIEHARDPIFKGACIVESGSHKAHIWFRSDSQVFSGRWKPRGGKAVGDIRGDGSGGAGPSYMVVPPSIHPDTGEAYVVRTGSFERLPVVPNGEQFLQDILATYLQSHPQPALPPPASSSKTILDLDDDERQRVFDGVRALKLKARIKDTLLVPGNQDFNSRHWQRSVSSHSEIDFAVCCELIRKGQGFEQIERIFAACLVGAACYRNKQRSNHGYSYLKATYDAAWAEVERERQAARVAAGTNFKVLDALRIQFDVGESRYRLAVECTRSDMSTFQAQVEIDDEDLLSMDRFQSACLKQIQFVPDFANNQQGRHFKSTFGQAVANSVTEVRVALEVQTRFGLLAMALRDQLRALRDGEPESARHTSGLGWRVGNTYYLRGMRVLHIWRALDHNFQPQLSERVYRILGHYEPFTQYWPDGTSESVMRLVLV